MGERRMNSTNRDKLTCPDCGRERVEGVTFCPACVAVARTRRSSRSKKAILTKDRPQERYVPPLLRFWHDFTLWVEGETGLPAEEQLGLTLYAGLEGRERPDRARRLFRRATLSIQNHRMMDVWALCERVGKHLTIVVGRAIDDPSSRCRCPADGNPDCSCDQDFNVEIARALQMYRLAEAIVKAFARYEHPWVLYEENLDAAELYVVETLNSTFPDLTPAVDRLRRERSARQPSRFRHRVP
jgi:hypothetical protein